MSPFIVFYICMMWSWLEPLVSKTDEIQSLNIFDSVFFCLGLCIMEPVLCCLVPLLISCKNK